MTDSHPPRAVLAFVLALLTLAVLPADAKAQNTFTVNSTGDGPDDDVDDNTCATSGGDCTLRAAIQQANETVNVGGLDQIQFDFSGLSSTSPYVIQPGSELPEITDAVVIDGSTEQSYSGSPVVVLDGQNAGSTIGTGLDGLTVDIVGVTIHALAIINFDDDGIDSFQPNNSTRVTVTGCHIGVRADGVTTAGNGRTGISGGEDEEIGGTGANEGNIVGGNGSDGISTGANSTVRGNFVGTNPGGDDLGNTGDGISLSSGDDGVAIGGTSTGAGNVIGFNNDGIVLSGVDQATVRGNDVGTNPSGGQLANTNAGILLKNGTTRSQIGGTAAGAGNVVGENFGGGILLTGAGTSLNTVRGNFIGTDANGSELGNPGDGIRLASGATNNQIGGPDPEAGNVISDNQEEGITITGTGTSDNGVKGNYVGTNASGTAVVGNSGFGIAVETGATSNTIGGTADGAGNVIAGNDGGVFIGTSNNEVQGNFIGTNRNGAPLGTSTALDIRDGSGTQVGGTASGAGNVMGNAADFGVVNLGVNSADATLQGNFIGTTPGGDDLGTTEDGIDVAGSGHTIGGVGSGEANTITNVATGVNVIDGTGHTVRGNSIFGNTGLGINLGNFAQVTDNDAGDGDDGQNRLQNFPEIQSAEIIGEGDIEVTYAVPSDPNAGGSGASAYPLDVDFYKADADDQEGKAYLGTDTYSESSPNDYGDCGSPPCTESPTFSVPSGVTLSESDDVVATATDFDGNTSEFSDMSRPLPVELTSFEGTWTQHGVRLTWATASETNNAGFRVERRGEARRGKDGPWTEIGFVDGHGTTADGQEYRFTDPDLSYTADSIAYRLEQVDIDGSTQVTEPIVVGRSGPNQLAFRKVSPNPAREQVTVRYAVPEARAGMGALRLYDVLGQQVRTVSSAAKAGRHETQLNVDDLTSGVYFLRLHVGGTVETQRFTVVQ
jgi:CSLREA domain-containing protein